jgi:hypothetical protein
MSDAIPAPLDRAALLDAMRACEQSHGQSVLAHGEAVWASFLTLVGHLRDGEPLPAWWRIPDWARAPGLLDALPPMHVIEEYLVHHDCGKPGTRTVGEDGRIRFPGHAAASEAAWLSAGGDPLAARLMGMDMDAHLLRGEDVPEFAARPEAPTLLLAALAEVHSNAAMFGGEESDSFKIKAKHLLKRGRQVMDSGRIPSAAATTSGNPGGRP